MLAYVPYVPCLVAVCQRQLKSWLIDWLIDWRVLVSLQSIKSWRWRAWSVSASCKWLDSFQFSSYQAKRLAWRNVCEMTYFVSIEWDVIPTTESVNLVQFMCCEQMVTNLNANRRLFVQRWRRDWKVLCGLAKAASKQLSGLIITAIYFLHVFLHRGHRQSPTHRTLV